MKLGDILFNFGLLVVVVLICVIIYLFAGLIIKKHIYVNTKCETVCETVTENIYCYITEEEFNMLSSEEAMNIIEGAVFVANNKQYLSGDCLKPISEKFFPRFSVLRGNSGYEKKTSRFALYETLYGEHGGEHGIVKLDY